MDYQNDNVGAYTADRQRALLSNASAALYAACRRHMPGIYVAVRFRQELREWGDMKCQTIRLESRWAEGNWDQLAERAPELSDTWLARLPEAAP
jgi:hypothetical protein